MKSMRKREREHYEQLLAELREKVRPTPPLKMVMFCPSGHQHIDEDGWEITLHKTHRCTHVDYFGMGGKAVCGLEWKPANIHTVGVKELKP